MQAADALVITRETILNIANKHGLRATFAPRIFGDECEHLKPRNTNRQIHTWIRWKRVPCTHLRSSHFTRT
jgi:hypothetical protein